MPNWQKLPNPFGMCGYNGNPAQEYQSRDLWAPAARRAERVSEIGISRFLKQNKSSVFSVSLW